MSGYETTTKLTTGGVLRMHIVIHSNRAHTKRLPGRCLYVIFERLSVAVHCERVARALRRA